MCSGNVFGAVIFSLLPKVWNLTIAALEAPGTRVNIVIKSAQDPFANCASIFFRDFSNTPCIFLRP